MNRRNKPRRLWYLVVAILFACGVAVDLAIAQSGGTISLNSPTSFPVDI